MIIQSKQISEEVITLTHDFGHDDKKLTVETKKRVARAEGKILIEFMEVWYPAEEIDGKVTCVIQV